MAVRLIPKPTKLKTKILKRILFEKQVLAQDYTQRLIKENISRSRFQRLRLS